MKELLKILNIKQILPPRKSNPERLRVMQIASLPCTAVHTQKGLPCIHKHAFRMQTANSLKGAAEKTLVRLEKAERDGPSNLARH